MRGILLTLLPFLAATFADRGIFAVAEQQQDDEVAESDGWAAAGECNLNPKYMWEHCSAACGRLAEIDRAMADEIENKIGHIKSFFELEARNIDKEVVEFDRFRGKVTVIANVASYCGESHAVRWLLLLNTLFRTNNTPYAHSTAHITVYTTRCIEQLSFILRLIRPRSNANDVRIYGVALRRPGQALRSIQGIRGGFQHSGISLQSIRRTGTGRMPRDQTLREEDGGRVRHDGQGRCQRRRGASGLPLLEKSGGSPAHHLEFRHLLRCFAVRFGTVILRSSTSRTGAIHIGSNE